MKKLTKSLFLIVLLSLTACLLISCNTSSKDTDSTSPVSTEQSSGIELPIIDF